MADDGKASFEGAGDASRRGIGRRDFLKLSGSSFAAVMLLHVLRLPDLSSMAKAEVAEVPVVWLQAGACSGCSVSFLNTLSPKVQDVLVSEVVPGKHVSVRFQPTIMAAEGDLAMQALDQTVEAGGFVLVAEGSFATKDNGIYCQVGEREGIGIPAVEHLKQASQNAMAVIALGTCAAYGGIPAASPNPTGAKDVGSILRDNGIATPLINIPGCPSHPDWFVGTVADILTQGLGAVKLDALGRPLAFFGQRIHDNCPRRGYYDTGKFAVKPSDPYCLYALGCKGPVTNADCPVRMWNGGTNWCVGCGHPCVGCTEPGFPDNMEPFFEKASGTKAVGIDNALGWVGVGVGGAAVAAVGAHLAVSAAAGRLKKKGTEDGGEDNEAETGDNERSAQ